MNCQEVIENYKTTIIDKYFCFEGRADRKSFWLFVLVNFVISSILGCFGQIGQILSAVFSLAVLCPSLGIGVRRMHDIGKSGWFILINLIPIVGPIIYIILCCQPSIDSVE